MKKQGKIRAAIVGARGYSGLDLTKILLQHPQVSLDICYSSDKPLALGEYFLPEDVKGVKVQPVADIAGTLNNIDVVFLATPAEVSLELVPKILAANDLVRVIDLSGAFRLQAKGDSAAQVSIYKKWYNLEHTALSELNQAVYGLSPFANAKMTGARLVSNPGCYATSVLMALLPLLKAGLIKPDSIVIDAKSGASGAGRKAAENLLFTEVEGECLPYRVGKHQHLPEIRAAIEDFSGVSVDPFFTTHLLPVRRGIISSMYAQLADGVGEQEIGLALADAFEGYSLARFTAINDTKSEKLNWMHPSLALSLKRVAGSARTQISYQVEGRKLYIFSLIDNLLKGAASQAVENLNCLFGLPVDAGLTKVEGQL